jgi:oligo-1,6-glucosidase
MLLSKDKAWFRSGAVYQIYPRSFQDSNGDGVGDLRGVIRRLDYLRRLGVSAIWLCPIYASPNDDNGYDISDYERINPEFGTMEDFEELLAAAHERGIRVILDMVLNHSSDEHAWFKESRRSKDSRKRDWYIWRKGSAEGAPNRWGSMFGGPAWELDAGTGEYYLHLFTKKQPDLNWENAELRRELYRMMRRWLDRGVDGFRLDVINLISKTPGFPEGTPSPGSPYTNGFCRWANGPRIHEYLKELNHEVFGPYGAMTVGETPGVAPELGAAYTDPASGELDMLFQFELVDLDSGPRGKFDLLPAKPERIAEICRRWQYGLAARGWNSLFWNNHDQPRVISRFGDDGAARELSGKMLAAFLYLQKGTPFIYQGEEIGMVNYPFGDPSELRDIESINFFKFASGSGDWTAEEAWRGILAKGRDNARTPMCWSSEPEAGFSSGRPWIGVHPRYKEINVEESEARPDSLFNFYRRLLEFRKTEPIVSEGGIEFVGTLSPALVVYRRRIPGDESMALWVGCNMSPDEILAGESDPHPRGEVVFGNYEEKKEATSWRAWEMRVWYE